MDNINRPTPETDAAWEKLCCSGESWYHIAEKVKALSQKFERDLNVANEELSKKYIEHDELFDEAEKIRIERDEALKLGNNLADECERILGLGLHQNTLPRFKAALEAWRKNT